MDISQHRVTAAPSELYYITDFITKEEEEFLMHKVNSAPKPKWVQLKNRRLQNWGGNPVKDGMMMESVPSWLKVFMDRVNGLSLFDETGLKTNHVLINEYLPGQGIMPHEDGPMFYPTIATINCGSSTVLKFEKKKEIGEDEEHPNLPQTVRIFLERRSLNIVKGDLYRNYLHSIEEVVSDTLSSELANFKSLARKEGDIVDRETRISLTIRHVLKVSKLSMKLLRK